MLKKLFATKNTPPLVSEVQLAFNLPDERQLDISESYEALPAWQFISTHICRYPLDLRAHSQRILLARQEVLQDRLPGSLLDLFLTLGSSGQTLKQHLFELSAPFMDEAHKEFFQDTLTTSDTDSYQQHWFPGSMLATGEQQASQALLSKVSSSTTREYTDVLTEVKACLEYGQVDTAQQLLEKEIMDQRYTNDIETELLAIYRHTQDKKSMEKLSAVLQSQEIPLSEQWIQLEQRLAKL